MQMGRTVIVGGMTDATRARTALAAASWQTWSLADCDVAAPYFEESGLPVLLVNADTADLLLDSRRAEVELSDLPELGAVRLCGAMRPVTDRSHLAAVERFRVEHADCRDCCLPGRTELIAFRVDEVQVSDLAGGAPRRVEIGAYASAEPDPIITHGRRIQAHLNTAHAADVLDLGARLVDRPVGDVLAASLDWVDRWGIEIAVIDADGSRLRRLSFRKPLAGVTALGDQLHQLLGRTGG